jgi:Chaperone of endosialidase
MNPLIQLRKTTPIFLVTFLWFGFLPTTQALLPPPPPDGGYPNDNTAEGADALFNLTSGFANTAVGFEALFHNTGGDFNTAIGPGVLYHNTIGRDNTATGHGALFSNTTGSDNTANGHDALFNNIIGSANTATGVNALPNNTTGSNNTATGADALFSLTSGAHNTANGSRALESHSTGSNNTAIGYLALSNANFSPTTGSNNIALGANAGSNLTTGSNNIDIGAFGGAGESNTIRIGRLGIQTKAFMQGIHGATVASGATVIVGSDGHLGTINSSARFKDEIKPMDTASEAILALKPVTFRYKKELDPESIPQFGLVAEEVAKVNPALVARDSKGEVYTVRYEAVNAMLLNEFLKEHRRVQELEANAARQQKQIEALTEGLQKVSAQLEPNKPAPQTVLNNQ